MLVYRNRKREVALLIKGVLGIRREEEGQATIASCLI